MYNTSRSPLEAKIVILGSQGVGKTSLAVRYISKTFAPNSTSTIGASFMAKKLTVDNCKVSLQIWDTAGQELRRTLTENLFIVVVANKLDLAYRRDVSNEEARSYITRILGPDTPYYEVSAKEDNGMIEDIFVNTTRVLVERSQYLPVKSFLQDPTTETNPVTKKSSCC